MAAFHLWTPPLWQEQTSGLPRRVVGCCHLSGLWCGVEQPPACMGVRGPGPFHPKRARSTVESTGFPDPVSPTVAPYSPSARPTPSRPRSAHCRGRSSVNAAFDQQSPDDASHLVGQGDGDEHLRLAEQHLSQPRAGRRRAPTGLPDHRAGPEDQQAADGPLSAFRNGAELLLSAGRFLEWRQPRQGRNRVRFGNSRPPAQVP